jgi:hypothetical protein
MQTQPSEMVERVAQALTDEFSFDPAGARLVARVAIGAMREPTEAMISLGDGVEFRGEIWREMIDEALGA